MSTHADTIAEVYAAFGRGDVPAILGVMADDVRWEHWEDNSAQRAGVPYLQPREGREGVAAFFAAVAGIDFHAFEVRGIAAAGDLVVADVLLEATLPNGARLRDEELHYWRFDADGRICAMRHYVDTAKHASAEAGETDREERSAQYRQGAAREPAAGREAQPA
jgi:ketosteroid isomerase-like protein